MGNSGRLRPLALATGAPVAVRLNVADFTDEVDVRAFPLMSGSTLEVPVAGGAVSKSCWTCALCVSRAVIACKGRRLL